MSPVCESDFGGNRKEFENDSFSYQNNNTINEDNEQSSSNKEEEAEDYDKKTAESSSNYNDENENPKPSKRNTFGFFDSNSINAIKQINENINKRMTLSNQRDSKDLNNL